MKILFIDDVFEHCLPLMHKKHEVFYAEKLEVVQGYLKHIKFDVICFDFDISAHGVNGESIIKECIMNYNTPVVVHSANIVSAKRAVNMLAKLSIQNKVIPIFTIFFVDELETWMSSLSSLSSSSSLKNAQ